jgi:hypothetical protein
MPCTGDRNQNCGGAFAINMYLRGSVVDGPRNLALGQPAYASSIYKGNGFNLQPRYAVDGVTQYFDTLSKSSPQIMHTAEGDDTPWLSIDLGASMTIVRVVIWNRCDCCQNRLQNAELRIGNTAISSSADTSKITTNPLAWKQTARLGLCAPQMITFDTPKVGRWVTIQNLNTDRSDSVTMQLTEVEVFGVGKFLYPVTYMITYARI